MLTYNTEWRKSACYHAYMLSSKRTLQNGRGRL